MENLIKEYANRKYPLCGDYDSHRYGNDRMNEHIVKSTAAAVLLSNGLILGFDKLTVKKSFWFADEGIGAEIYDRLQDTEKRKKYFFSENLKGITEKIENLKKDSFPWYTGFFDNGNGTAELCVENYNSITSCGFIEEGLQKHERLPHWHLMEEEDRKNCIKELTDMKKKFEKRLESYWKNHSDCVRTHTYWADR